MPMRTYGLCLLAGFVLALGCGRNSDRAWQELYDSGWAAYQKARYAEAERLLGQAVKESQAFDESDLRRAQTLDRLAWVYHEQGKDAQAEPLARQSLELTEKTLGPQHETVGIMLNTLAAAYQGQGKFAEAQALHERAIEIAKKTKGDDHPQVANSLNNLASLHAAQGQYDDAESLYRDALVIRQTSLPPEHPDIARSLHNLANVLKAKENFVDAELVYKQAMEKLEASLGADHQHVAACRDDLANLYFVQSVKLLAAANVEAAEQAKKYLALKGWRDELSQNLVLIAHFALLSAKQNEEARAILDEAAQHCETTWWPYPVIRYVRGEIEPRDLEQLATDNDKLTEVHTYIGLTLSQTGNRAEAAQRLNWVKQHGNRQFIEYDLAIAELARLEANE